MPTGSVNIQFPEDSTKQEIDDFVAGLTGLPGGASVIVNVSLADAYNVGADGDTPQPVQPPGEPVEPPASDSG